MDDAAAIRLWPMRGTQRGRCDDAATRFSGLLTRSLNLRGQTPCVGGLFRKMVGRPGIMRRIWQQEGLIEVSKYWVLAGAQAGTCSDLKLASQPSRMVRLLGSIVTKAIPIPELGRE